MEYRIKFIVLISVFPGKLETKSHSYLIILEHHRQYRQNSGTRSWHASSLPTHICMKKKHRAIKGGGGWWAAQQGLADFDTHHIRPCTEFMGTCAQ